MELQDYVRTFRRNWILIVSFILIGALGGGIVTLLTQPVYTAETQLFVATQSSGSVQDLQMGSIFIQARVSSYVETATTPTVLQPVIDSLGLDVTPEILATKIKATSDLKTVLIAISADDESPVRAAAIAQAVAHSLISTVDNLEKPNNGGPSPVRVSIVTPATAPVAPSSPNTIVNLALGILIGLTLGIAIAILRTTLDTRVRNEQDLKHFTNAPVLGGIAFDSDAAKTPLVTENSVHSQRSEPFRQLRTNLQFAHVSHKSKSVLVTSSLPGEGKTTTAINLAVAMAESGQTVALVDADLRRPTVATYLGLESRAGLSTALIGQADVRDLMQPWGRNELHVLTSGRIPPNPSELLGSADMKQLILRLEQAFDAVIIDAPPLLPVTDAAVLAQEVGGVILVVGCQATKQPQVEKAMATLELVDANLLGVVLNKLPIKGPDAYAYNYYGYESAPPSTNRSSKSTSDIPGSSGGSPTDADFDALLRGRSTRSSRRT